MLHSQWWTYAIFAAEVYLLTALTGFTVGKRLIGLRVVRLDGRPVGFGWALVRTVLLLAVIPAVVFDRDTRGLHDSRPTRSRQGLTAESSRPDRQSRQGLTGRVVKA